jgi:hypothetical protein
MQVHANEDHEALMEVFAEFPKTCGLVIATTLVLLCYLLAEMLTSSPMMKFGTGISYMFRGLFYAVAGVTNVFCTCAKWLFDSVCDAANWMGSAMDFVQYVMSWPFTSVWAMVQHVVEFVQQTSHTVTVKSSEAWTWLYGKFCAVLVLVFVRPVVVVKNAVVATGTCLRFVVCTIFVCMVVSPVKWVYDTGGEIVGISVMLLGMAGNALIVLLLVPFHIALWMKRVSTQIAWAEFCSQLDRLHKYIDACKKVAPKPTKAKASDFSHRFKNLYYLLVAGGLALAWWWIIFLVHMTVLHVTEFDCVLYITGYRWTADMTFRATANVAVNFVKNVFMDELKRSGILQNALVQACMRRIVVFMRALFAPFAHQAGNLYGLIALPAMQWPAMPVLPAWPGLRAAVKVRKI